MVALIDSAAAVEVSVVSEVVDLFDVLSTVRAELNKKFFEREDEIDGLLVSILAEENVLLLGSPGTGKSDLAASVLSLCLAPDSEEDYFEVLISDSLPPSEIFGDIDLRAMREGKSERNTDFRLPNAKFALLDEIFKATKILNTLLKILNEGTFYNGGKRIKTALSMVVGASNELPEDGEGLEALWDRFILRYHVAEIGDTSRSRLRMGFAKELTASITSEELAAMREEVEAVEYSKEADDSLTKLEGLMVEAGLTKPSTRRTCKFVKILKAYAYLCGDAEVNEDHFGILAFALWEKDPVEMVKIKSLIQRLDNPIAEKTAVMLKAAKETVAEAMKDPHRTTSKGRWLSSAGRTVTALDLILQECQYLIAESSSTVSTARLDKAVRVRQEIEKIKNSFAAELQKALLPS